MDEWRRRSRRWNSCGALDGCTPQREAVVDGHRRLTYEQFFERCDRWSTGLQRLGVRQGDRVAYIAPNIHQQLESFYAVPQIGAVLVPINFRLSTVVDTETGEEVPHDGQTIGEIVVRGNVVLDGYYHDPEATAKAIKAGWFHSGDAATGKIQKFALRSRVPAIVRQ